MFKYCSKKVARYNRCGFVAICSIVAAVLSLLVLQNPMLVFAVLGAIFGLVVQLRFAIIMLRRYRIANAQQTWALMYKANMRKVLSVMIVLIVAASVLPEAAMLQLFILGLVVGYLIGPMVMYLGAKMCCPAGSTVLFAN